MNDIKSHLRQQWHNKINEWKYHLQPILLMAVAGESGNKNSFASTPMRPNFWLLFKRHSLLCFPECNSRPFLALCRECHSFSHSGRESSCNWMEVWTVLICVQYWASLAPGLGHVDLLEPMAENPLVNPCTHGPYSRSCTVIATSSCNKKHIQLQAPFNCQLGVRKRGELESDIANAAEER